MDSIDILPFAALGADAGDARVYRHVAMGTEFCLYLAAAHEAEARACSEAVFAEVDRVEAVFSRFDPASEIPRLNRLAAAGPVVTDPEVFGLLTEARSLWEKTGGVFDIALGRLSRAWGFPEHVPHLPAFAELAEAQSAAGMALVELDPEWRTVRFLHPGVELDLGAFAKGYAVDCALGVLRQAGVAGLLDAGHSSIAAVGDPFANNWRVAINLPREDDFSRSALPSFFDNNVEKDGRSACTPENQASCATSSKQILSEITLGSQALATSGIMEQKFKQDGRMYSHLLDPRKKAGVEAGLCGAQGRARIQTTVLAPTSALADALSTALFLLGPEEGWEILERFEHCAALWIFAESGHVRWQVCHWPDGLCSLETMQ